MDRERCCLLLKPSKRANLGPKSRGIWRMSDKCRGWEYGGLCDHRRGNLAGRAAGRVPHPFARRRAQFRGNGAGLQAVRRKCVGRRLTHVFYEVYDDRAAFEAHLQTPHFFRWRDAGLITSTRIIYLHRH